MAKGSRFVCSICGASHAAWSGKCSVCGEWNALLEETYETKEQKLTIKGRQLLPVTLKSAIKSAATRIPTNDTQLDRVLGGGFVAGSVLLIAGEPGIGKSTLLLQVCASVSRKNKVLYISGEESADQVSMRASRLCVSENDIHLVSTSSADDVAATMEQGGYDFVVVDSVQTMQLSAIPSSMGSVAQITNVTHVLSAVAKRSSAILLLVGHVTKEGSIAGPKVLEHSVDVVLQLEGDRFGGFKILRAVKNRFGSTNEAAIFQMGNKGLEPVLNPSAALLEERQVVDGSVVFAAIEGTRSILVEIQALVNQTSYGYPKRAASGFDLNRLNLLIAVLERRTKLQLTDKDIYINVVGGIKLTDNAADLAVCMAIGSAAKGLKLKSNAVVFGEIGLSGEVRHVTLAEKRLEEAKKMGFDGAIGPRLRSKQNTTTLKSVETVREALNTYLEKD
jgi:DNA repair protein RadA/Sms